MVCMMTRICAIVLALAFTASGQVPTAALAPDEIVKLARQKIKYVFVLYQENRSFDSYFGTFPGAEGLFTHDPKQTPGFYQQIVNLDGTVGTVHPFRIGPALSAADTDDVDHSHPLLVAKMNLTQGVPAMDRFALTEERKFSPTGNPTLKAKQMGELTMAYEDCDTVPLIWRYAQRFVLFDHFFQEMAGPSTLGNISIIAAQTGQTQWVLHPDEAYTDNGSAIPGVPILNDNDPFWGSQLDTTPKQNKMPVNPRDLNPDGSEYGTAINLTFASLPLTLWGSMASAVTKADTDAEKDLADVRNDVPFISARNRAAVPFGWFEEGYGSEPVDDDDGPLDAYGLHASYVTHHNGPQYFGYVANNPKMREELHSLHDFFTAVDKRSLPKEGGVFFVKGGYRNILKLKPANSDPAIQKAFPGDDDHPGYSDAQISEALVATSINRIAASPYWKESAIILTWDDSEGDYDHVPPPIHATGPDNSPISDGPRVPLIMISPWARTNYIAHGEGNHASVVKFIDTIFDLPPLALLPDEKRARDLGEQRFGQKDLGPQDALTAGISDLMESLSPERLSGKSKPLSRGYVRVPDRLIKRLPPETHYGCKSLGIVPTDRGNAIAADIPSDFNPRPVTNPTPPTPAR